jgi:signal peptidase
MTMRRLGSIALWAMLLTGVVGFAALAIGPRFLPYRTVTMLTGSMGETAPPGSMVVDVAEPVAALRPGQVISFHAPVAGRPVVTHRVLSVQHRAGQVLIRTRGDANPVADPWLARVDDQTVWRMQAAVPHLGQLIRLLRTSAARVLLVWVAPAALLVWFLVLVWRPRPDSAGGGDDGCLATPAEPPSSRPAACSPRSQPASRSHGRRRHRRRPHGSTPRRRSSHHRRRSPRR